MSSAELVATPPDAVRLVTPAVSARTQAIWLVVLVLAVYANATLNGFVLDDRAIVLDHPLVRDGSLWRAFVSPYWP